MGLWSVHGCLVTLVVVSGAGIAARSGEVLLPASLPDSTAPITAVVDFSTTSGPVTGAVVKYQ